MQLPMHSEYFVSVEIIPEKFQVSLEESAVIHSW
jgi:hypothetical protein